MSLELPIPSNPIDCKLYICVHEDFPDYMTPTLVAHTMLGAHLVLQDIYSYDVWLKQSFKKVVCRVNQKEFDKICALPVVYIGYEKHTMDGKPSCVIPAPYLDRNEMPSVLKFAKLWKPREQLHNDNLREAPL